MAALLLNGCGGGSNPPAVPATPGACGAGQVYAPQYGCLNQGACPGGQAQSPSGGCISVTSTMGNCSQTNQGPAVYTQQYGCLPQGSCPVGQGAYVANGMTNCIPGQVGGYGYGTGYGSCPANQVMTAKGCLPSQYPCPPGTGFFQGQCYASQFPTIPAGRVRTSSTKTTRIYDTGYDDYGSDDTDLSDAYDSDLDDYEYRDTPVVCSNGSRVKIKVRKHKIKIKIKR
jgi:hypothetical protein